MEAANKMLVTHRLKRSGQRWGRDRGHLVLDFVNNYSQDLQVLPTSLWNGGWKSRGHPTEKPNRAAYPSAPQTLLN